MSNGHLSVDEAKEKVVSTLRKLFERDRLLFEVDAAERCIFHKFGEYLGWHFPWCDTDCEYNRDEHNDKKVIEELKNRGIAEYLYPDVIVHRRTKQANYLIVQGKKSTNTNGDERKNDHIKLHCFTRGMATFATGHPCKYDVGLFLDLLAGKDLKGELVARGTWFVDGEPYGEKEQTLYRYKY